MVRVSLTLSALYQKYKYVTAAGNNARSINSLGVTDFVLKSRMRVTSPERRHLPVLGELITGTFKLYTISRNDCPLIPREERNPFFMLLCHGGIMELI